MQNKEKERGESMIEQIKEMIEKIKDNPNSLKEVYNLVDWKMDVNEETEPEMRKLADIYYFLKGILVGKKEVKA